MIAREPDPLLGCFVEIRSVAGVVYRGVVQSIRRSADLGELFELGSASNGAYQRFVHVVDRLVQIRRVDD